MEFQEEKVMEQEYKDLIDDLIFSIGQLQSEVFKEEDYCMWPARVYNARYKKIAEDLLSEKELKALEDANSKILKEYEIRKNRARRIIEKIFKEEGNNV